jgi:hypothetical protein
MADTNKPNTPVEKQPMTASDYRKQLQAGMKPANSGSNGGGAGAIESTIGTGEFVWRIKGLGERGLRWSAEKQVRPGYYLMRPSVASKPEVIAHVSELDYSDIGNRTAR